MYEAKVTRHAGKRIRERVGLNKKAVERLANKALNEGLAHKECKGQLHHFVSNLFKRYGVANGIRVYSEKVFIFAGSNLITVMHLPHEHKKTANKLMKGKQADDTV